VKKLINWLMFVLTARCDKAVAAGLLDLSGQGRDKYGN
jgi:hypothetical protein